MLQPLVRTSTYVAGHSDQSTVPPCTKTITLQSVVHRDKLIEAYMFILCLRAKPAETGRIQTYLKYEGSQASHLKYAFLDCTDIPGYHSCLQHLPAFLTDVHAYMPGSLPSCLPSGLPPCALHTSGVSVPFCQACLPAYLPNSLAYFPDLPATC